MICANLKIESRLRKKSFWSQILLRLGYVLRVPFAQMSNLSYFKMTQFTSVGQKWNQVKLFDLVIVYAYKKNQQNCCVKKRHLICFLFLRENHRSFKCTYWSRADRLIWSSLCIKSLSIIHFVKHIGRMSSNIFSHTFKCITNVRFNLSCFLDAFF